MSAAAPVRRLTEAEYIEFERTADVRHEYSDGEVFAMAGGTFAHSQIAGNLIRSIGNRLPRSCAVLTAGMRVKSEMTGFYTYPDLSVVCGERRFLDDTQDTLLNPVIVVEVLSEATEAYDRGRKFEHYRRITSLKGYLLVCQDYPHLELFSREDDGAWKLAEASGMEAELFLPSLEIVLPLSAVYMGVEFQRTAAK